MPNPDTPMSTLYINHLKKENAALKAEVERLKADYQKSFQEGHSNPCTFGSLCPYCEIERLKGTSNDLRQRLAVADMLIEALFASATPNPNDHPAMYQAWAKAGDYLTDKRKKEDAS